MGSNKMIKYTNHRALKFVQSSLAKMGIGVMRNEALVKLNEEYWQLKGAAINGWKASRDLQFLLALPNDQGPMVLKYLVKSQAEFRQDLFVLSELNFKHGGYFVEFGATNGHAASNTYLLEKEFSWEGILCEPARIWHAELKRNRTANIDTRCVWSQSGATISFNEVLGAGLSTINSFSSSDCHSGARQQGFRYDVETVSLNDLLSKYNAPTHIDYLSIDTEGSELEILKAFDFNKYGFRCITVEHNHTPMRDKIYSLLTENGYVRKYVEVSQVDDWYVKCD
jgi:FkbM family methyltransferase